MPMNSKLPRTRIVFFSSQFFNVVNYLVAFSKFDREIAWTPLVSSVGREIFENRLRLVAGLTNNVLIRPIYLKSPNSRLRNLLKAHIVVSDFCNIFRVVIALRPQAVVVSYVFDAFPIALLKRILGCKVFLIATGSDINLHQSRIHVLIRRIIYSQSDVVFAVSNDLRQKILHESRQKALLLPTAVDTAFFRRLGDRDALRAKWQFGSREVVILSVGNLTRPKGVDVALRAVHELKQSGIGNIKLAIVGRGSEFMPLKRLVADLSLEKNVVFLGEMYRDPLLELYNAADIFILSSRSEGLPFVLLEAMACETVCVASPVGDVPAVLRDGENGFIVRSMNPTDFAEKIQHILAKQKSDLARVTRKARRIVLENMDMDMIARNMMRLIHENANPVNR